MTRAVALAASLLALSAAGGALAASAGAASAVPVQQTVALLASHTVYASPGGTAVSSVASLRPITHERTVLPVLASAIDNHTERSGQLWLEVRLPGRTLAGGTPPPSGWIVASRTALSSTPWHLVVDIGERRLLVYEDGREVRDYRAIVGKAATPTPTGEYFVEENVKLARGAAGAPFALATSDRSAVLHEFEGGPGEIAIHGIENLGGTLGTAESHGCVRIANSAIAWLAARITPGVPITIR